MLDFAARTGSGGENPPASLDGQIVHLTYSATARNPGEMSRALGLP